jgi:hypothetical protein
MQLRGILRIAYSTCQANSRIHVRQEEASRKWWAKSPVQVRKDAGSGIRPPARVAPPDSHRVSVADASGSSEWLRLCLVTRFCSSDAGTPGSQGRSDRPDPPRYSAGVCARAIGGLGGKRWKKQCLPKTASWRSWTPWRPSDTPRRDRLYRGWVWSLGFVHRLLEPALQAQSYSPDTA